MSSGRRPTALERRRRQARVIAVVVALAMLLLVTVPLLAYGDEQRTCEPRGSGCDRQLVRPVLGADVARLP